MRFHIAEVVRTEDHPMADLTLDAKVDLHGTWCLVIGSKQRRCRNSQPLVQKGANKVRIRSLKVKRIAGLILLPERENVRDRGTRCDLITTRVLADPRFRRDRAGIDGDRLWLSAETSKWRLVEGAG